ncbi:guanitoxin biosynthesis L-enduracididine beta-hydroxylase GntD [Actinomadura litoris]|uniref:guanitoxin biosynthesis L-enduracididine beta-hydroxylase GntD n=1 Tax=Actinomadura litoris TaxID=2678616 RepID=UPI001FA7AB4A|nr:guanitoxin biosynthesis L-enduracididine beta-hydroxylase GntD [Actinomadura litoris]
MASVSGLVHTISAEEAEQVERLTLELCDRYDGPEDEELLTELPVLAAELPLGTRRFLRSFALEDELGYCVIRGHRIDDMRIGDTPPHWRGRPARAPELPEEFLMLLHGALLGEPFGWRTQQDGRLVHDIFPIKGYETEQMGIGSEELLTLHTEDAFHPWRADFLLLGCLRNPKGIASTVSGVPVERLGDAHLDALMRENFVIRPDNSHLAKNNADGAEDSGMFDEISRMLEDDIRVAVLWGDRRNPYIRIDPYFMEVPDEPVAKAAFHAVEELLESGVEDLILEPGDVLVINNHRLAHGRRPFHATHDGRDRWLKRVSVTTDLRKSRSRRGDARARLI